MAGHVDEVPVGVVPATHSLDDPRIWSAGQDASVGMTLLDADLQLICSQPGDAPRELLLVRELDPEAAHGDLRERIPVVVQR